MQNWFETLNAALESENLLDNSEKFWPPLAAMAYGETRSYHYDDGSRYGHHVTIYRDEQGRYERPVHYAK